MVPHLESAQYRCTAIVEGVWYLKGKGPVLTVAPILYRHGSREQCAVIAGKMDKGKYFSAAFSALDRGHRQAQICSTTILDTLAGVAAGSAAISTAAPFPSESESSKSSSRPLQPKFLHFEAFA